ncbi:MAG TPA: hypothetical protein VG755_40440 [Nannocystaceae bacterium]|nr:hypothetical protein [Nannocystaceae bacterium]
MSSAISLASAWITGLGAVTSVGLDAATTCASIRAGIARPSDLDGHESHAYLDYSVAPTTGHVVPDLAKGFSGVGRWIQLAVAAIEDLCTSARLPTPKAEPHFWASTVCELIVPEIDERFEWDPGLDEAELSARFRDPVLRRVASVFSPRRASVLARGRHGVLEVMRAADWQVAGIDRIIVLATDSLVDLPALRWLDEASCLKNDMNPVGLSPGEASIAILLEHPRAAKQRGAVPMANLHTVATNLDPERSADKGPGGVGLGRAALSVLERAALLEHGAASFVSDLNGEVWRARELAAAQQRVGHARWHMDNMVLPIVSTGDPGTAMPALQIAVATKSLQRGYAGGASVLVTSSDPAGRVGAALVAKA